MQRPDPGPGKEAMQPSPDGAGTVFLFDLSEWRGQLARSIARNNIGMRSSEIALAVNRILFRFCILAIAEDRGLITPGKLRWIAEAEESNLRLGEFFADTGDPWAGTDGTKDSNHRHKAVPGIPPVIDDEIIRSIATRFSSVDRPYDFSQISLEDVAGVIDQYLARTIRRSAAHQAVVVDRPGAGIGAAVDPEILTYAATNTLAAARASRPPEELLPLRILDPACGAGALVLRAFHSLVRDEKHTFAERKEILEHSLFGLDIDSHAVAAARILLSFGACEGEDIKTLSGGFFAVFSDLLHILSATIRCGNALVGPEIADDESWAFCPAHERHAIQPFDWQEVFFEIFAPGGFDVVICCPPECPVPEREWLQRYFQRHYAVYDAGTNLSAFYIEKALSLLRPQGVLGFVTGAWWLHAKAGAPVRELLLTRQIEEILFSGDKEGSSCFLRLTNTLPSHPFVVRHAESVMRSAEPVGFPVDPHELSAGGWTFRDTRRERVFKKISLAGTPLETSVLGGIQYDQGNELPEVLVIDALRRKRLVRGESRCKTLVRPYISGEMIGRYSISSPRKYGIFIPRGWTGRHAPAPGKEWQWFKKRCPGIARYLEEHKAVPNNRSSPEEYWWECTGSPDTRQGEKARIVFPAHVFPPTFTIGSGRALLGGHTGVIASGSPYLLGLLNSRLAAFVFASLSHNRDRSGDEYSGIVIGEFPVYTPDSGRSPG